MPSTCPDLAVSTSDLAARAKPWRLPARAAFPLLAAVLFAFFFAAAAPSPLFVGSSTPGTSRHRCSRWLLRSMRLRC